jgi:hypothetical protein
LLVLHFLGVQQLLAVVLLQETLFLTIYGTPPSAMR